jgi:hypothetical protein
LGQTGLQRNMLPVAHSRRQGTLAGLPERSVASGSKTDAKRAATTLSRESRLAVRGGHPMEEVEGAPRVEEASRRIYAPASL